ncbi:hypothetical protein CHS0354_024357 [Potamilus streckersoni]|uniref:Zonadhesin n=1 Tax=Potamilus streckersoni TaxID=2493646 RepID=A0AAE0W241_9BIVA|nr:hypothetical protein CHS0354_024357 [Potamilus streckersoni]
MLRKCGKYKNGCHESASCQRKGDTDYCACNSGYYGNGVDFCGGACTCTGSGDPHYKTFDGSMIHFQGICKYILSELSIGSPCDYRVLVQNEHRYGNTRVSFTKRVDVEIRNTTISLRKDRALFVNRERKYTPFEAGDLTFSIFMRGSGEIVVQTSCKVVVIYDGSERVSVTVPEVYGRNITGLCGNCNGDRSDDFLTKDKLDVSKEHDRYARIGNSFAVPDPETPPEICAIEDVKITCSPEFKGLAASNDYCGLLRNIDGPFASFIKNEPTVSEKVWEACVYDVCSFEDNLAEATKTACKALENFARTIQENGEGQVKWRTATRCPLTCGENMEYSLDVGVLPTCTTEVQPEQYDVAPVDGCKCKPGFVQSGDKCVRKEECGCKTNDGNQYLPVGETFITEDCRFMNQCQYRNGKSEIVTVENRPACHSLAQCRLNDTIGQYSCQCQKGTVGDGIISCISACGNTKKPCHPNAICIKGMGKQVDQCRCKDGYYGDGIENCTKSCECVASGDPHYTTFDGQKIHFQGLCKYTLASIPYCSINVEVKNQPVPGNKVSTTKLLEVKLPSTKIRIGQKKTLLVRITICLFLLLLSKLRRARFLKCLRDFSYDYKGSNRIPINGEIAYAPIEGVGYRIYEKGSMVVETDCGVVVMFDGANTARVLVPSQYGNNVMGICGNCDGIQNDFRTKTGRFVSWEANKYSLIGDSYSVPDDTEQGSQSCQTESFDPTCPLEWESKKRSNEYCGLILDPKGPFGPCLAKYPEIAKDDGIISDCTYDVCANSADPKNAQAAACTALAMLAYRCQQKSDIDIIAWRKNDFCPMKECGENMVYNPAIMQCSASCQDPMRRTPCHAGLTEGCECKPGFFRSGAACVPRDQCGCTVQGKYYPLNTTVTSSDCKKRYICVHKDGSSYMERFENYPPCGAKKSCRLNDEGNYQCQCDKDYKGDGFTCENVCGIHSKVCHKYASCLTKGNTQYCSCNAGYYGNGVDSCGGACTCTGSGDPHYKTFDGSMIHFQGICKYVLSELSIGSECDYRVFVQNEHRQGNTRVSFTKRVDIEIGDAIISLRKDRVLFVNRERKYPPFEADDLSFSIFMRGSAEIVVQTSCKVIVIFDGNQRVSVTAPDVYGKNLIGLCGNCNGNTGDDFLTKDKLDVSKEPDRYARIGNSFAVPDKETPPEICPTEDVKIKCSPEFLAVANSTSYCGLLSGTTGPFADFIKREPEIADKYFEACLFDVCSYEGNLTEAKRTACDTLDSYAKALQEKGLGRVLWRSPERCPLACGENMEYSTNVGVVPTCSDTNGVPKQQFDVPTVDGCVCKQGFVLSSDRCVRKTECGCKVDNRYLPLGEKFATEDCRFLKQCQYQNGKSEIVTLQTRPACHLLAQCKPDETTGQYTCQCQKGTVGDGITSCIAACGYANKPCHSNAICSKGTGKQLDQCRCKEGYYGDGIEKCTKSCECVASGDPHYTTFDGQKIHFQGLCKYTLASIPYCSINVEVKNQPVSGNKVSTTKLLEVKLPSTKIRIGQKKNLLINGEIAYAPIEGVGYRIYEKGSMVVETYCGVVVMFDGVNTARVLVPSQYGNNVMGICGNCDGIQNDFRTKTGRSVSGEANKYNLIGDSYAVPDDTEQGSKSCQTESFDPTCPLEWESKMRSNEYCGLILDPKGPFGPCLAKYPEIAKGDGIISDCTYDVCANSADPKNAQAAACNSLALLAYRCQQKSDIDIIEWRRDDFCPMKECGENMVYNPAIMQCSASCQDPMRRIPCHAGLLEGCECKPGFFRSGAACVPREQCGCSEQSKYYPLNTTVTSSDCRKRYVCVHKDGSSYMERLEDSPPCGARASCRLNDEGNYQCQCDKDYKGDGFTCENLPPPNENGTCSVTETTTGCSTVKIIKGNCYFTSNFKGQCRYVVKMINANAAIVYIGDSKVIRLDSYNIKEYVDCAAFKMESGQVTVTEPTCGCQ